MTHTTTQDALRSLPDIVIACLQQYGGFDSWWGGIDEDDSDVILRDLEEKLRAALSSPAPERVDYPAEAYRWTEAGWVDPDWNAPPTAAPQPTANVRVIHLLGGVAEVLPPKPIGDVRNYAFIVGLEHSAELHNRFAALTAAMRNEHE